MKTRKHKGEEKQMYGDFKWQIDKIAHKKTNTWEKPYFLIAGKKKINWLITIRKCIKLAQTLYKTQDYW